MRIRRLRSAGYHESMSALELLSRRETWHPRPVCSPALRPWLVDEASLSARIAARAEFGVRVLSQGIAPALPDERVFFGRATLVREVLLCADGVPVVFARSVLDAGSRPWRAWHRLGSRPLACLLFGKARVARTSLAFRGFSSVLLPALAGKRTELSPRLLPARRRFFVREGSPLLLTEVFLPSILEIGHGMDR